MRWIHSRHARNSLLVALALVSIIYYFTTRRSSVSTGYIAGRAPIIDARVLPVEKQSEVLGAQLAVAEDIYQRMLVQRHELIKRNGPTPDKILLFPPDQEPWPPYTVWDFFPAAFNCPFEVERVGGLGDGGKWICGLSRIATKPDCIIYSLGIAIDSSSFENHVLRQTTSCQIWAYDHRTKSFGNKIDFLSRHRTNFKPWRIGGENHDSNSEGPPTYKLSTVMAMNGHTYIDLLKIDIEGAEFDTLTSLIQYYASINQPLPFGQLHLEIHLWDKRFPDFLRWWEMLENAGLRPYWSEPNLVYANYNRDSGVELAEYSFINIRGIHEFTMQIRPILTQQKSDSENNDDSNIDSF